MCDISQLWFSNRLIKDMLSHISCIRVIFSDVCFHMCSQISFWPDAKSQKLQMCKNFWIMISKRLLKLPAWTDAKSHRLHLYTFSPEWVFKCIFKLPARTDAKSHWLHLCDFIPVCIFKCAHMLVLRADSKPHWLHLWVFLLLSFSIQLVKVSSERPLLILASNCWLPHFSLG